jgi:hypothetical protein
MPLPFGDVRIGEPIQHGSLTVFPLFQDGQRPADYLLADEAIQSGVLTVEEVSNEGRVPDLLVNNQSAQRVLFLEGEELRGAKQNRILNASVLAAAGKKTTIPVSCVEQGRWRRMSVYFMPSMTLSPSHLRYESRRSVRRSLEAGHGHQANQLAVWDNVAMYQKALGVQSPTRAQADTFEKYEEQISNAREALRYPEGACGLAVAFGSKVVSLDVFDKPATCQKVWHRFLSGFALEGLLPRKEPERTADVADVSQLLDEARTASWGQTKAVGDGEEFRAEFDDKAGTALVLDGAVVHGSVLAPSR